MDSFRLFLICKTPCVNSRYYNCDVTQRRSQSSAKAIARKAGLTPLEPYINANKKWKSRCNSCQQTVYPRLTHLLNGGKGCRKCGSARGRKKIQLSEAEAKKRLSKAGFKPLVKYPGSHFKWKSQCLNCKTIVFPKLNQIESEKSGGCLKCGQVKRSNRLRLDERKAIDLLKERGFVPLEPYKSALSKWKVTHVGCNSKVIIKLNSLTSMGSGCPACAGRQVVRGFNDLKTTHPELAKQLVDKSPREITAGSHSFANWQCKMGHVWKSRVADRTSKLTMCPFCSNKKVLPGFNDFATHYPDLALEAFGWDPSQSMRYSKSKKKWRCQEGHIWTTSLASRSSGSGCPECTEFGFIGNKPGYLYLLYHDVWEMLQIGITNYPEQRLKKHSKLGWIPLDILGPMNGDRARNFETHLLRTMKAQGIDVGKSENKNKFDGYSESWNRNGFKVESIEDLLCALSINLDSLQELDK